LRVKKAFVKVLHTEINKEFINFCPYFIRRSCLVSALKLVKIIGAIVTIVVFSACSEDAPPPQATEVVVDNVSFQPYQPNTVFVGRLQAQEDVRIQAKVTGYLLSRNFTEGDLITKGALLYEIDPVQYEAGLALAKADTAKAKAAKEVADLNLNRGKELAPLGAISASDLDKITATKLQADAELQATLAQLKSAEVNLSYTSITAPISGRIGRSEITPGDLIGPDTGLLTSLVSIDPINATFQVSEALYLRREESLREQAGEGVDVPPLTVRLELSSQEIYPQSGYIDYIANRIDEATGTIEGRAVIPNAKGILRPGQYVKVILEVPYDVDTLMLPQAAVQADQQGNFVFTVGADNKVQRRNVELDARVGDLVVVKKGVEDGDKVIVRGLQKVRPGQMVKVEELSVMSAAAEKLREKKSSGLVDPMTQKGE
jgi:membrane fusion protein (multidrug efflux system)